MRRGARGYAPAITRSAQNREIGPARAGIDPVSLRPYRPCTPIPVESRRTPFCIVQSQSQSACRAICTNGPSWSCESRLPVVERRRVVAPSSPVTLVRIQSVRGPLWWVPPARPDLMALHHVDPQFLPETDPHRGTGRSLLDAAQRGDGAAVRPALDGDDRSRRPLHSQVNLEPPMDGPEENPWRDLCCTRTRIRLAVAARNQRDWGAGLGCEYR